MSNENIPSRFDEIYNATNKPVLAYITAKCGRTADISDIFQETYLELYRVLTDRGADYIKHEKAFVMRIAKHKIARHYTLAERLRMFVSMSMTFTNAEGEEVNLSDLDYAQADAFLTEDFSVNYVLLETAQQFIHAKPEIVQKVFYLMYEVGLTIPEIAQTLSISESSVKNKLYRTLKELRALL